MALNRRLEQLMPVLALLGVLTGFLLPRPLLRLQPLAPALFAVMTLSGAMKLRGRDLGLILKKPLPVLLFFAISHILLPLLVFSVSFLIFGKSDAVLGFVLLFSSPTAVSGFIWVSLYGGDRALSLALILLDTLAAPLVAPAAVSLFSGEGVSLDMGGMVLSLFMMVVFPTIIGVSVNEASRGGIPAKVSPYLGPVSKLCLTLVVSANSASAAGHVHVTDPQVWLIGTLCVIFAVGGFAGAWLASLLCRVKPDQRVSLFFAVGLRNISAAATMAIRFFAPATALPAILGIVSQQTLAALMGKIFLKRSLRQE